MLAKIWARQKIEDLMQQTYYQGSPAVEETVTAIALDYRLMSQYTSFVAVDAQVAANRAEAAQPPRRMLVPVPLPEGTRWEGFFGEGEGEDRAEDLRKLSSGFMKKQLARLADAPHPAANPASRAFSAQPLQPRGAAPGFAFNRSAVRLQTERQSLRRADPAKPAAGISLRKRYGGFGGGGPVSGPSPALPALKSPESTRGLSLAIDGLYEASGELGDLASPSDERLFTRLALASRGAKFASAAAVLYKQATGEKSPLAPDEVRRLLMQACLLDSAAANLGLSEGKIAADAIERLQELHDKDVKEWSETNPKLTAKLNLVIRDQSLAEALAQVAQAAGLEIRLLPGSDTDAAALLGGDVPRISYLDLRHATVAQALDWILQPDRLTWWADGQTIIAGSERRREGQSGWVYDVSAIALPLAADFANITDTPKAQAEALRVADEFLAGIRTALKADEVSVLWYGPGQLLVFGDAKLQAAAGDFITSLREGKSHPRTISPELFQVIQKRSAARKAELAKAQTARRSFAVAAAHDQFSWQLAAAALSGKLDLEALTELAIAWKSPQTAELLAGSGRSLLLRSLWSIGAASQALPAEKELAALADACRQQAQPAVAAASADATKEPTDMASLVAVLFAAAANPSDPAVQSAGVLVAVRASDDEVAADLRTIGRMLIGPASDGDRAALAALLDRGIHGADQVALAALACQHSGSQLWQEFRAHARDLLGSQPLPGELIVLVNVLR